MFAWDTAAMGEPPVGAESAIRAVAEGLDLALGRAGADDITTKQGRDIVTATDVLVEDHVRAVLGEGLEIAVVGEERGGTTGDAYWLVDPICGTRNYASGIPLWCVNLALVRDGEPVLAAIGDPSTDEVLVAHSGGGAWALSREGCSRRLRADDSTDMVIVEDGKADGPRRDAAASFFAAVVRANRWDLHALSSTISAAYVGAGRVSAYACFYVTSVHTAAGVLLAREAGALVTDVEGGRWTLDSDSLLIAATEELHADLLALP